MVHESKNLPDDYEMVRVPRPGELPRGQLPQRASGPVPDAATLPAGAAALSGPDLVRQALSARKLAEARQLQQHQQQPQ